ncbi:unnamed protein product [Ranitomeya imitator]|uniref:ribonuclease H n=1 Tax=Ranitomeya imitator TaxID=111125 RepID=A0ABN9ME04_9NEOB|nr:unnamed protein product [Ranitomeya imitator]
MVGFPMPAGLNESMSLAIHIGRRLRERKSVHHLAVLSESKPEPMQCDRTMTKVERQEHRRLNRLCFYCAKKDGSLRPCIDYRLLNKITVKFQYPLPLISDLFARIKGASWFTKIDLRGAYNLVRIRQGDEWKTAFNTPEGHFEYLVMPFGLANAPSVFQSFMHDIFREYLDKFLIVYLDDILIFSDDWKSHVKQVRMVFQVLRANSLFVKGSKCLFGVQKISFLGFIFSPSTIEMDPVKVQAIQDWTQPTSLKSLQKFLGFANFYRRFICNFSSIARPLTDLTKKGADLVEVDASEIGAGAVLSQRGSGCSVFKPCAFFSRKFSAAERNYDVGNRELLAMKWAFEEWRHWLEGAKHRVVVLTDHKNLTYLESAKRLNPRQARQVESSDCPGVDSVVDRLQQIWTQVVDNLTLSQEKAQLFANRRRRVGPRLRVGDLVVVEEIRGTYGSICGASSPCFGGGELEYIVEKILDSRVSRRKLQYLVKWKGYAQKDNSWVFASDVHAPDLVRAFHGRRPVTLIGFSLGARVIYFCLQELAQEAGAEGIIEDVVLLGAPVEGDVKKWQPLTRVVAGRIINGYCRGDWLLSFVYRSSSVKLSVGRITACGPR